MRFSYRFRLYPSKIEEEQLFWTLEQCRLTYNRLLEELNKQSKPDRGVLQAMLPEWKRNSTELKGVYSKVLQHEVYRLFSNLHALAESKKQGRKVGRLRFKGRDWFKTFTYNQSGFKLKETSTRLSLLHLSKIGDIPIMVHRPIEDNIKQITIKHTSTGKWYAFIQTEIEREAEKRPIETAVGIDVGLTHFAVDSDGVETANPRWLKQSLKKLRREQRKLSRKQKKSRNRGKQQIQVAKVHEKVVNQRDDFLHKLSRQYVDNYDLIVTEDLIIPNMVKNRYLSRSIMDACWGRFNRMVSYKAENAGKIHLTIDPWGTTQECSVCGAMVPKTLKDRVHHCHNCGTVMPRDYNSALNILNRGLTEIGLEQPELTPVDIPTSTPQTLGCKSEWLKQDAIPL